jgi:hypothetical protein
MTFRASLTFTLPATAADWSLSSVRSFAMRRVREHAVAVNASVVEVTDWGYQVEDVKGGQRVTVTCTATLRSRRELIEKVQHLMAERNERPRCRVCDACAEVDTRHAAGQTIHDACKQVGVSVTSHRNHRRTCAMTTGGTTA